MKGKHFYPKKKNRFAKLFYLVCTFCIIIFLIYCFKDKMKETETVENSNVELINESTTNTEIINDKEKTQKENNDSRKEQQEIEKSIENTFNSLKQLNKKKIKKYLDYDKLLNSIDEMIIRQNDKELEKALFTDLSYKIKSINIEKQKAIVNIEVVNKDYKDIYTKWTKEILNQKNKKTKIDEKTAMKILKTIVKKEKQTKKINKEITLNKKNDNWIVEVNTKLRDLVFPGIDIVDSILANN